MAAVVGGSGAEPPDDPYDFGGAPDHYADTEPDDDTDGDDDEYDYLLSDEVLDDPAAAEDNLREAEPMCEP